MVSRLPQLRDLELELLGEVEVLILDRRLFLGLHLSKLLAHLSQSLDRQLQLLGQVEVLLANSRLLLLLQLPDLIRGL